MALSWQEIQKGDATYISLAFALLKSTINGYDQIPEAILIHKMQPPGPSENDPNSNTANHCLRIWSYGDRLNPLVSAFFFLRRRKKQGNADAPGLWANCLTVGAKFGTADSLSKDELIGALNEVCCLMRDLDEAIKIEVMQPQSLVISARNVQDAFDQMRQNAQPPKTKPRFEEKGTITLGYPWVPNDSNGNEVSMDFVWWLVVPKP